MHAHPSGESPHRSLPQISQSEPMHAARGSSYQLSSYELSWDGLRLMQVARKILRKIIEGMRSSCSNESIYSDTTHESAFESVPPMSHASGSNGHELRSSCLLGAISSPSMPSLVPVEEGSETLSPRSSRIIAEFYSAFGDRLINGLSAKPSSAFSEFLKRIFRCGRKELAYLNVKVLYSTANLSVLNIFVIYFIKRLPVRRQS